MAPDLRDQDIRHLSHVCARVPLAVRLIASALALGVADYDSLMRSLNLSSHPSVTLIADHIAEMTRDEAERTELRAIACCILAFLDNAGEV